MRKIKIVADSSANLLELKDIDFASAPLKIITDDKEFIDNESLNPEIMVKYFDSYKGKSKTSCPNPSDWLYAFGDADDIFCNTITSGLSGSYNSACLAKDLYESQNEGKRVYVIDSLSTGPEMVLIIDKLCEYIKSGMEFNDICKAINEYTKNTGLIFMLKSLKNFAANGRVSPALAKITGILDIRIIGRASVKGELEPLHKCRGEAHSLNVIANHLAECGVKKGKIKIAHCQAETAASKLLHIIKTRLPDVNIEISENRALCSYYAEKGGLLVGFEKE